MKLYEKAKPVTVDTSALRPYLEKRHRSVTSVTFRGHFIKTTVTNCLLTVTYSVY